MLASMGRALIGIGALVVAIVLFIVLQGGGDDSGDTSTTVAQTTTPGGGDKPEKPDKPDKPDKPEKPEIPVIVVKDGEPVGGVQDLTFTEGDDIQFKVESDVSDEVHFHGYDVGQDVEAGGSTTFDVPATITGAFEVELEQRVTQIAEITVEPS